MRKIVLSAMMALSMVALAQTVTPLSIEVAEVKIDSLRSLYIAEPTMYRASLDVVAQQLAKNEEEVKTARAVLKEEQKHAAEKDKALKEATKMTASLRKLYDKEESELKAMQKTIEGQQRTLSKQKELNKETRDSYQSLLEKQQKELGYSIREVADRKRSISELETVIQNGQTELQSYVQKVQLKAADLEKIEAQLKERTAVLKAEQKTAKKLQ
jgi:Chromosome segregation ATPases